MSTHSNPFIQGGWFGHSQFSLGPDNSSDPASVCGALPMTGTLHLPLPNHGISTFHFTASVPSQSINVLNSIVIGPAPAQRAFMRVTTDASVAGYTTFKDGEGRSVAAIEWPTSTAHSSANLALPKVEIRGTIPKISASEWLRVSSDPRFGRHVRQMEVRGAKFVWCPYGEALHLYTQQPNSAPCIMVTKTKHVVKVDLTQQAIAWGLLEPSIIAITLFLSGRRLE